MTYDIDLVIDLLVMADDLTDEFCGFTTTDKLREAYNKKYADVTTYTKKFEEHLQLLFENKLIDGSQSNVPFEIFRVTWSGRDLVANARDKESYDLAKKVVADKGSFGTFVEVLDKIVRDKALKSVFINS